MEKPKLKKRLPLGRPEGIPQPSGPERIRRKVPVIYDSILKRAVGGDAACARLCLEIAKEIPPMILAPFKEKLLALEHKT